MQKITIIYADDIVAAIKAPPPFGQITYLTEDNFTQQPMSKRVEWVQKLVKIIFKHDNLVAIYTNDYVFIKLLEIFTPRKHFAIFDFDSNSTVKEFTHLVQNPTLDVYEFLTNKYLEKTFAPRKNHGN